jgi:hypothetical protein
MTNEIPFSPQPFFCTKRRKVGAKEIYWQQIKIVLAENPSRLEFFSAPGTNNERRTPINDTASGSRTEFRRIRIEPTGQLQKN